MWALKEPALAYDYLFSGHRSMEIIYYVLVIKMLIIKWYYTTMSSTLSTEGTVLL